MIWCKMATGELKEAIEWYEKEVVKIFGLHCHS